MKVRSSVRPKDIEITPTYVFIASNITPYEEVTVDGRIISGFEYECTQYTKDEYLLHQINEINSLAQELKETKELIEP